MPPRKAVKRSASTAENSQRDSKPIKRTRSIKVKSKSENHVELNGKYSSLFVIYKLYLPSSLNLPASVSYVLKQNIYVVKSLIFKNVLNYCNCI